MCSGLPPCHQLKSLSGVSLKLLCRSMVLQSFLLVKLQAQNSEKKKNNRGSMEAKLCYMTKILRMQILMFAQDNA